ALLFFGVLPVSPEKLESDACRLQDNSVEYPTINLPPFANCLMLSDRVESICSIGSGNLPLNEQTRGATTRLSASH
ncbi:MAG TPA: hypothetical protein VH351_02640, partial [Bryobacteraceae bacterium]|nr:hypothetical protein [Bryobacteraceae bacterium]